MAPFYDASGPHPVWVLRPWLAVALLVLALVSSTYGARAQVDQAETKATARSVAPPRLPQSQHGHPSYPASADGHPARVLLELTVDEHGAVTEATTLEVDREPPAREAFDAAAHTYAAQLRFEPALRAGQAVPARIRFEILFQPPDHQHPVPQHSHDALVTGHAHAPRTPPPSKAEPPDDSQVENAAFTALARVRPAYQATSSVDLRGEDLRLRPFSSAGDLLNAGGGFYVIQHAGGGKANQYFLRGFDADHGTDVAFFVDGIPVNNVSHGHGQGYTELQWVIPELVERMELRKGPYAAEYGDFATAGAVNLVLSDQVTQNSLTLGGGTYGTFRALSILNPQAPGLDSLLAAEVYGTDGPFKNAEDLRRVNLFGRVGSRLAHGGRISLTATSYLSGWNANGQLPSRAVRSGALDRFGTLDPSEGGATQRHSIYASLHVPTGSGSPQVNAGERPKTTPADGLLLTAWLSYYQFALYSNFTYFSVDPENGDMIRQGDRRVTGGLRSAYEVRDRLGDVRFRTRAGVQLRFDNVRTTLNDAPERELGRAHVNAGIGQGSIGLFAEEEVKLHSLRGVFGARADYFAFNVQDSLEDRTALGSRTSGERQALRVSPKASLIWTPVAALDLFANFGLGFHSNDARGVVVGADRATPLTQARGYELGARLSQVDRFLLSLAAFRLDLGSETVWIGDAGTTEGRGRTRRIGLEAEARVDLLEWLALDADATWTNATYVDNPGNADAVSLAPTFMIDGGATVRHRSTGLSGRLGIVYVADRPATEDDYLRAQGFYRLDATAKWKRSRFELALSVQNLTNAEWRQAQFATTSRLADETGPESCPGGTRPVQEGGAFVGCEDINFTPGWPLHILASATLFF